MEAMEVTRDELEQENLADDNLIHRDEESPQPEVKDDLAGELTKHLEKNETRWENSKSRWKHIMVLTQ